MDTKDLPNNTILTEKVGLSLDSFQTKRNNNILVIGDGGSRKTQSFILPNLLQSSGNYIAFIENSHLDSGLIRFFKQQGYCANFFDIKSPGKSCHYNPLKYIKDYDEALIVAKCLTQNSELYSDSKEEAIFLDKWEHIFLAIIIYYVIANPNISPENKTLVAVNYFLDKVIETQEILDLCFSRISTTEPDFIQKLVISCKAKLSFLNQTEYKEMFSSDDIGLDVFNLSKNILFIFDNFFVFPAPILTILWYQILRVLVNGAPSILHTKLIIGNLDSLGQIPEFTKILPFLSRNNISINICTHNLTQIKNLYPTDWESIVSNCDSFLFLGCQEYSTLEYISKLTKVEPYELLAMSNDKCILIVNGFDIIFDNKYKAEMHPSYNHINIV